MNANQWVKSKLQKSPRTFKSLIDDPTRVHRKSEIAASGKAIGCGIIRTSYGEKKVVYWTINHLGQRRWICCEFTPIEDIQGVWAEEILDYMGYEQAEDNEEVPEPKTWYVREGRYYWTEEGPCPKGWRNEDAGLNEQNRGMVCVPSAPAEAPKRRDPEVDVRSHHSALSKKPNVHTGLLRSHKGRHRGATRNKG